MDRWVVEVGGEVAEGDPLGGVLGFFFMGGDLFLLTGCFDLWCRLKIWMLGSRFLGLGLGFVKGEDEDGAFGTYN